LKRHLFRLSESGSNSVSKVSSKSPSKTNLPGFRNSLASRFTGPVVRVLARTPVTPNFLSWSGFILALGAAALIIVGYPLAAGIVVLVAGFFDILDGALARLIKRVTPFGAVLDATLDRLSEGVVLLAILAVYAMEASLWGVVLAGATLLSSQLVSYIRARAEAQGLEGKSGIFTRAERVVILALGLLLSCFAPALTIALAVIVVFSLVTVVQRLVQAWRQKTTA
jgi:CDP-diacylglycerol--glycerol-3-phosphate 3-phosphatidyltransferase